jgi:hypothetical protein
MLKCAVVAPLELNFDRIRPCGGSRQHGFEELCSQLASLEVRPADATFYRKGVGPDAGVECFLRYADGAETGWQAKYFGNFGSGQTAQLDESVGQALEKHPRLETYIVCLPINLKDSRAGKSQTELERWEAWRARWQDRAARDGRRFKIGLWDKTALVERLGRDDPLYSGREAFWFDETNFTPTWFKQRFDRARAGLGQRYTPETNIELPIRQAILSFCRNPSLFEEIEAWDQQLAETAYRAIEDLRRLAAGVVLDTPTATLETAWQSLANVLSRVSAEPDHRLPLDEIAARARATLRAASDCMRVVWELETEDAKVQERIRYVGYEFRKLEDVLSNIIGRLASERWQIVNDRRLLVFGEAGIGKSHLFGDAVDYQVSRDRPALLILGGTLIEADPWSQIIEQLGLDLPPEKFLGALDAAGQAAGTRAVIFVDAINERHGIDLWRERLPGFLQTIESYPRVAVVLSCRSTYLSYIVDGRVDTLLPRIEHVGFAGRAAEAARFYLDRRGIVRMAAPNLVPEFENPLFLKTCCDYLEKEGLRELPRGLRGVSEIFRFYTEAVARAVETRLKLDRRLNILRRALDALAGAFDEGERGYLEYDRAAALLEQILPSHGDFERSLLPQLESEGVLAVEPVTAEGGTVVTTVRFTFERFSDHRIAKRLFDQHLDVTNPKKSFAAGTPLYAYVNSDTAYEHAGVIEAMAIQLPERCGLELQDALPEPHRDRWLLHQAFLSSVLWRNQTKFTQRTIDLLNAASEYTGQDEAMKVLIAIATEPENAFNALFLHDQLMRLPMADRDQKWSIYIAQEGSLDGSPTLITWTAQNGLEHVEEARAELAAVTLGWLFSTSHRGIRDRATKALAALLSTRLEIAARLIRHFEAVDDPYILDRVLASAYGAALQGLTVKGLGELAQTIFSCIFDRDQVPVHVLIRDHARGIIELARWRGVLPSTIDIAKARPPYRSAWPIEDVSKETVEGYTQEYKLGHRFTDEIVSSSVNDGDFARYVVDHPVGEFSCLPIAWVGSNEKEISEAWRAALTERNPEAELRLKDLIQACEAMRKRESRKPLRFSLQFIEAGKRPTKPRKSRLEQKVDVAEERLHAVLGDEGWSEYCEQARAYIRRGLDSAQRRYFWPPSFGVMRARRWICKRAHDLGWTPERFGTFDREVRPRDRYDHQVERIGKKYQWIAFHQLLAHLADNVAFVGWNRDRGLSTFDGPWQVNRRDIDPSLLAVRANGDDWRQWDATWWMPAQTKLKPISPRSRLVWLDSADDFHNDPSLIDVVQPKSYRRWLVVSETSSWHQWGVRQGEKTLDRHTWFSIRCVLVRREERGTLINALSGRLHMGWHDLPELEIPGEGYVGEYPWHPVFSALDPWVEPSEWNKIPVPFQPVVTDYLAERSGHDYSIEESFRFNRPAPNLITGLRLHLSNGQELTYADERDTVMFFDPTVKERGPSAALVDREAFLEFLKRENLEAVWIIAGEKNAYGGRKYKHGFGGTRSFTSVYWLTDSGFQRRDHQECHQPRPEQLQELLDEDQHGAPAT